ncbi:ADP-glyceromanno-heptose 6-epimerase [Verrucomicrobiota bacterium]
MTDRFIVTGGAGFIGCNIATELNKRGHENIIIVDNPVHEEQKANLESISFTNLLSIEDFREKFLQDKLEPCTAVFHMGACSSTTETNEEYINDNNYLYTRQLCEWCLKHNVRFIYASSAATYGDGSLGYSDEDKIMPDLKPLNLYGNSKQMFDMWALENGLLDRIAGLKYFNVYGPHEDHKGDMRSVVNKAYDQVLQTGRICLFKSYKSDYKDGEQKRDFVYVKDAVKVTLFFLDHPDVSGLFNCGTGQARTWHDLTKAVFAAMGKKPEIIFVDMPDTIKEKYQYYTQADISKLQMAGYAEPFCSIEDGVKDYVQNYLTDR